MSPSNGARSAISPTRADRQPAHRFQSFACRVGRRGGHRPIGLRLFDRPRAGGSFLQELFQIAARAASSGSAVPRPPERALSFRANVALGLLQRHELEDHVAAPTGPIAAAAPAVSVPAIGAVTVTDFPGGTIVSPPTVRVSDTGSIVTFIV